MKRISTLSSYDDWFDKAKYEYKRYKETARVYDLANCILTLNALPEWIAESEDASDELRRTAREKIDVMKGRNNFIFDEGKFSDIDQKLRFIRIFSNHSKHAIPKEKFPKISMSAPLPAVLPIEFGYIQVGNKIFSAKAILKDVIQFWEDQIFEAGQLKTSSSV